MSEDKIKAGDVVRLKSGGPYMTVLKIQDDFDVLGGKSASCVWFAAGDPQKPEYYTSFPLGALELQSRNTEQEMDE